MTDRDAIEARLCKLRAAQEAATGWGAAVGARSEEIKGLESQLRRLDLPSPLSPETASVRFGFASYKGGKFELIAINIKTGEEITLEGQLRPDQTLEQIDKVLPTCVYVNGVAQTQQQPVAWRYKCQDGSEVLMLKRLTDEQKRRGYYTGEDGEDEVDDDEAVVGPFHWAEETPLYAAQTPALAIENAQLRNTIQLHAGDAMSLSRELDDWRERALAAEAALADTSTDRGGK